MSLRDHVATEPFQQYDHDLPEDGMYDVEMVVASERVKLGQKRAKRLGVMTCGNDTTDWSYFSQRHRQHARLITYTDTARSGPRHCYLCSLATSEAS